jgi:hypothetical protein
MAEAKRIGDAHTAALLEIASAIREIAETLVDLAERPEKQP